MDDQDHSVTDKTLVDSQSLLPYARHVGSAIIRPLDKGRTRGVAMQAMYQQTDTQLQQIREQVETLIRQAQAIHDRINLSEKIYKADCGFKPVPGHTYFLYSKKDGSLILSLVSPAEWGNSIPYIFMAEAQLLADHTWKILQKGDGNDFI
jgi:hypothetical protein